MKRSLTLAAAMAACLAFSCDSFAQRPGGGSGGIGAGGGFGGGGLGGGGGFGGGGLGGGMGGGGLGGGRGLGGGLGGGGLGGGLGGGGFGQGGMGGGLGAGLGMQGQMGFGSGRNQNFVGTDSSDLAAMFQGMAAGAQGMAGQSQSRNRGAGQRGGQQRNRTAGQGSSEQATSPVRVRLQVAFDYPLPSTTPGGPVAFEPTQYDRILEDRQVENFAINRVGSRVVITGVAADASERLLMEKLVSLEPGVTEVENQMTVAEPLGGPIPPERAE